MADEDQNKDEEQKDEQLRPEGLRALQAERESNKELRAQLKHLQDQMEAAEAEKLSKEEQATKRAEKAEAELQQLRQQAERRELLDKVSKETEIPSDLLVGETEEQLRASADRLKEFRGDDSRRPNLMLGQEQEEPQDDELQARQILGMN